MVRELRTVKDDGKIEGGGWDKSISCVRCCSAAFHLFYSRLVNIQSLTVILLGVCVCLCVCVCVSLLGEKWNAETPTPKMFRSRKQNCEAMCLRQQLIVHSALCSV